MRLTDWIVILAVTLIAIAFYCARSGARRTFADRARHRLGTCLLMLGALALWAALLTLQRSFISPGATPFGWDIGPHGALALALLLIGTGCIWSIRGARLLRTRRLFRTR